MKPTVDNILAQYNIRPYNGSWYVTEKKLREVLEQIIDTTYSAGRGDGIDEAYRHQCDDRGQAPGN